jgi:phenylalanyl-tRNA synthetase alpha chain
MNAAFGAELDAAEARAREALLDADSPEALRATESRAVGKRSELAGLQRRIGALSPTEIPEAGQALNRARTRLQELAGTRGAELAAIARRRREESERLDLTEPVGLGAANTGIPDRGHLHLVTQVRDELEDIFCAMGFRVAEGPEAETDWYNFEALNIPADHPARGMWDTFYLRSGEPGTTLLRAHTSPVQIRLMQAEPPPLYAVMPGRCYRRDTPDARHLPVFHQIEGLVVDRGITFGDLAGTIEAFTTTLFGPGVHSRLRPSYFPFTEPSAEFEVTCPICAGAGCRTCSGSGWIELGGCGMVHPNVFAAVGVDTEVYTGFAFGFGIDRLAQVRTGLADMRMLQDNDVRFLSAF